MNSENSSSPKIEEMEYDDDMVFGTKPTIDSIIGDLIQRLGLEYKAEPGGEKYNPRKHAHDVVGTKQRGFHVYYAFPNGTTQPVASFWTMTQEGKYRLIHIDLGKAVEEVIKYYENRGHSVPPPKTN